MIRKLALAFAVLAATARPAAAEPPASVSLALIIANNRSSDRELPDLQYADDDGARYWSLFGALPGKALLLTTFDRASRALHPAAATAARRPTFASVREAVTELAADARRARAAGSKVALYVVYAGHGAVRDGRGHLDLEDGQVDGPFLERAVLERVDADVKHVILDSCNSFFVLSPRKPGGRRWATPKDMALGFAGRHPDVGLLLSTSAEAEVYEWSEVESGIFSHEVRSGLSGAADANGDGVVSYAELAGFIHVANARIEREQFRPHVFARGPRGDGSAPLFPVRALAARRLTLEEDEARVWIRGASGERLLDLHKERGPMTIALPSAAGEGAQVYVRHEASSASDRPTIVARALSSNDGPSLVLARLERAESSQPRGFDKVFSALFATPFGPAALQRFTGDAAATGDAAVYGVGKADEDRVGNYLRHVADLEHDNRRLLAGTFIGLGVAGAASTAVSGFETPRWNGNPEAAAIVAGASAVSLGVGLLSLRKWTGERLYDEFVAAQRAGKDSATLLADMERGLEETARRERILVRALAGTLGAAGVMLATWGTIGIASPSSGSDGLDRSGGTFLLGAGILYAVGGVYLWNLPSYTDRVLKLMHADPGLNLSVGVAPAPSGGLSLGISGRF